MPVTIYSYVLTVRDGDNRTHRIEGTTVVRGGDLPSAMRDAMRASFDQLTGGTAVYGQPGAHGCRGPYRYERIELQVAE